MNAEERFRELSAKAGEHFDDYLLVVRSGKSMMWKSSDGCWALGAAVRFSTDTMDRDRFELIKEIYRGEE